MATGYVFKGAHVLLLFFYSQIYSLFSVVPLFQAFWVALARWLFRFERSDERLVHPMEIQPGLDQLPGSSLWRIDPLDG